MKHSARHFFGTLSLLTFLLPVLAQDAPSGGPLVVMDLRPDEEREGTGLAPLAGKCNKDVFRIADVATDPLKVDILKQELTQQLPVDSGKTLTVLNWSIYYNKQIQKGGSFLKGVGVQGYTVPGQSEGKQPGSKCSQKESAGGWYLSNEVTGVYFPLISEFTGTFAGKPLNVRVVYSPSQKLEGKFEGGPRDTAAVLEAVRKTIEELAMATVQ